MLSTPVSSTILFRFQGFSTWVLGNPLGQVEGIFREKLKDSVCDPSVPAAGIYSEELL